MRKFGKAMLIAALALFFTIPAASRVALSRDVAASSVARVSRTIVRACVSSAAERTRAAALAG